MEEQQNQYNQTVNYWKKLVTFYSQSATMTLTLIDNEGSVAIEVAPALDGVGGRPQKGQARYDYQRKINFKLSLSEMQTLITAFRSGLLYKEQVSYLHVKNGNTNVIASFSLYNGRLGFSIKVGENVTRYTFNATKINYQSETYIQNEFELFVSILEGVIANLVFIKSGLMKEFVKTNKAASYGNGADYNVGYQAPENNSMSEAPWMGGSIQPTPQPQVYQAPVHPQPQVYQAAPQQAAQPQQMNSQFDNNDLGF